MTITVVYAARSGMITSQQATYTGARNGAGSVYVTGLFSVGQASLGLEGYAVYESFVGFDLSDVGADDEIIDCEFSLVHDYGLYDTYNVEARLYDWGPTLTSADWVKGGDLTNLPLLAYRKAPNTSGRHIFTNNAAALATAIADHAGSDLELIICSSDTVANVQPAWGSYDYTRFVGAGGTADDPKLIIEHAPSSTAFFEAYNGASWGPLPLEAYNGASWEPLPLEQTP